MAAPTCVIVSVKDFTYRGVTEEFQNRYMFTGGTPADSTAWRALYDALTAQEKLIFEPGVRMTRAYGYDRVPTKGDSAVWSIDLRVAPNTPVVGTALFDPNVNAPGDCAAWIRWGLDRMVHGKRVYLRKYYHPAYLVTNAGDDLCAPWKTAASAFGQKLHDGTFIGGRLITDKLGTAVVGHGVSQYATTRTLKRRGKRPPAP